MEATWRRAALGKLIELAQAPSEGAILVQGEPGIGKSHLLDDAHRALGGSPLLVRINPAESAYSLSGVSSLMAAIRGERVTEFGGQLTLRSQAPDDIFTATHDLLSLLCGLRLPPTLVLIDDFDRMDAASQVLIGLMATRLIGTEIRLAATTSTPLTDDGPLRDIPRIQLNPLPMSALMPLAMELVADADPSSLRIVSEHCGGNPRVLEEQLRRLDHAERHVDSWLMLPPRGTATTRTIAAPLLATIGEPARKLLETIALAPLCHSGMIVHENVETSDSVEDLVDSGILRSQGPYLSISDPRIRLQCYWSNTSRVRRERHDELAENAAKHSIHLAAWHRSFIGYDSQNIDELLSAAIWLVEIGQVVAAVEYAERALRKTDRVEDHLGLIANLSLALLLRSEATLAARYSSHLRPQSASTELATRFAMLTLAANAVHKQSVADDEVKAMVQLHAGTDPVGAASLITLASYFRAERWEADEARALLTTTDGFRSRLDQPTLDRLDQVESALDALLGKPDPPARDIAGAEDLGSRPPPLLLMHGRALSHREQYAAARHIFTIVLNHPDAVDRIWEDLARYGQIGNEIAAGQFGRARETIDAWRPESPWANRTSSRHAYVGGWYDYSLGRLDTADNQLELCRELASREDFPAARARALALRGTIALMQNDLESAVIHLRQVTALSSRFRNPSLLRQWADYVEACVLTNRPKEAEGAVSSLERRLAAHETRWGRLALLRSRALMKPGEPSLAMFAEAIEAFEHGESPYERGRVILNLADRQELLGLGHEAGRTRASAMASFEAAGATGWAQLGVEVPPDSEPLLKQLTEDERAIVQRVREGMRNKEIAGALYVSVRTVELRLTRVYRALGVQSRSQLIAMLSAAPDSATHPSRSRRWPA